MTQTGDMHFAIIGGDIRQTKLCRLLLDKGYGVSTWGLERSAAATGEIRCENVKSACAQVDCVILPMPLCREGTMLNGPLASLSISREELFAQIEAGTLVCAGGVDKACEAEARAYGLRIRDYLAREDLVILNAIPTAEGAIQMAMQETDFTIFKSTCLVIGNGNIGKVLSQRLAALGASVSVSARSAPDFAKIKAAGYRTLRTDALEQLLGEFDIIFNTVPHLVLGVPQLRRIKRNALIIDLASKPGGVDFTCASELGISVKWALSLPGKVAPLTSAKIVMDTVFAIIEEDEHEKR